MVKEKKEYEKDLKNPLRYIQNLLGEKCHIPIKTTQSSNGGYIQYEREGDTYFKSLSLKIILKK